MNELQEYIEGIPNISGNDSLILEAMNNGRKKNIFSQENHVDFNSINSVCSIALHMHQPLIPAGGGDLRTAEIISNLKYMFDNQGIGDNHNASVFLWCYKRMGDFIPQLLSEGKEPRVMLEYSGTLLHGLRQMGANDVIDNLKKITCDPGMRRTVEWLGCPWGHAVAPSTPVQDYRLHVKAWQQHFAAIFGLEALGRVRGFSPSEMALPNNPDISYEYVKTLRDCGFTWMLVQEHTVELSNGKGIGKKHLPHRLVCRNSKGESVSIIAIIKTQGSDTKLVAQMQPYYEAKSVSRVDLAGKQVPPLVTQIADGENGGVMMNEFPGKFLDSVRESSGSQTQFMNASEYLEHLESMGITEKDFPEVIPLFQKRIWDRFTQVNGPEKLAGVIDALKKEDNRFNMEGGSWTNNISWVNGYENVIGPMEKASSLFYEKVIKPGISTDNPAYRKALFFLLTSQTSCYRYWGQGIWTDYGREICRRCIDVINYDIK
ncbi:MAG TPA: glycosyl hydrolase family 57 [Fibrobacteres bacterium]|jgi:hypothetical protein|nr:glycosyl hydrolase family 57 [Fibrobacterota bacterium]